MSIKGLVIICRKLLPSILLAALVGVSGITAAHSPVSRVPVLRTYKAPGQLASAFSPRQIADAYDISTLRDHGLDGSNQRVALIELGKVDPADLRRFDDTYHLPKPMIREYFAGGRAFSAEKDDEATMDVEWLHALAPAAAIQLYYVDVGLKMSRAWQVMGNAIRTAADRGAEVISISLGACRAGTGSKATRAALADVTNRNVSVFVSSGDTGDRPGPVRDCGRRIGVGYPSSDPSVVSVGGTSLELNDDNSISKEVAWRLSGGGRVLSMPRPVWQTATTLPIDKHRWAPDVAFLGDPDTGVGYYFRGRWRQAGGTSVGSPAWAAIWCLIRQDVQLNQKIPTAAPALLYRVGNSARWKGSFHDITSGSNGRYHARRGWDPVTGWGTPDAANLANAIVSISHSY